MLYRYKEQHLSNAANTTSCPVFNASSCSQRKEVRLLICTDVAARGIDIHGVPYGNGKMSDFHCKVWCQSCPLKCQWSQKDQHDICFVLQMLISCLAIGSYPLSPVINVTLPDEKQNYVHRIGRVGRAERYMTISHSAFLNGHHTEHTSW